MSYLDSSYFSDNNGHIICSILIYRLKDMNYSILNELMSKNNKTHFIFIFIQYYDYLVIFVYLNNYLEFKL